MNYLDEIAVEIRAIADPEATGYADMALYRIYAVLALVRGTAVDAEDVHHAWAAWAIDNRPQSKCIVPFADLSPEIQQQDEPYVEAIRQVVRQCRRRD